jgi:transposase
MMGRQTGISGSLNEMIPKDHLLWRIDVVATAVLAEQLRAFYSDVGPPSVDPELMIRMLLIGNCYGIRHERDIWISTSNWIAVILINP